MKAIRDASPQARHHFTQADQVHQLVSASEADPDRGFMARLMALCSLPRTNPGNRHRYVRRNGPYTLIMAGQYAEAQKQSAEWANRTTALAEDHQKMGAHVTQLTDAYEELLKSVNKMSDVSNAVARDMNELMR